MVLPVRIVEDINQPAVVRDTWTDILEHNRRPAVRRVAGTAHDIRGRLTSLVRHCRRYCLLSAVPDTR